MCCFDFNSHLIRDPNGNAENIVIAFYIIEFQSYRWISIKSYIFNLIYYQQNASLLVIKHLLWFEIVCVMPVIIIQPKELCCLGLH